jgi:hypothetical protein
LTVVRLRSWARRSEASVQGSTRQGRPRRGRRSLTPAPGGARCSGAENGDLDAAPVGRDLRVGARFSAGAPAVARPLLRALSVIPSLPSVLGWFGPVVGSGHPRGAGVAVIPLPSVARGDWPPGSPIRPGRSLRIADLIAARDRPARSSAAKLASTGRRDLLAPQGSTIGTLPPRR